MGTKPKSLSYKHLRRFVDKVVVAEEGEIMETSHAKHGHPERSLTFVEIVLGLAREWTLEDKQFSQSHGNWKYKLKGTRWTTDAEADLVMLIVCYPELNKIKVITRW
jgi:hypothetical protein